MTVASLFNLKDWTSEIPVHTQQFFIHRPNSAQANLLEDILLKMSSISRLTNMLM